MPAFYFTKSFGEEEKWSFRWYVPIRDHELVRSWDLLPDEADLVTSATQMTV